MVKSTDEKEKELQKLKSDLEVKKRKVEEDKSVQESRSDPESVTSSLTADTTVSGRSRISTSREGHSLDESDRKRKAKDDDGDQDESSQSPSPHKIARFERGVAATEESSGEGREAGSGTGSGSGSGSGSGGDPSAHGTSMTKTISTVSDLTDSNQCSSSNNSGSATESGETVAVSEKRAAVEAVEHPSTSSISSDAAVASEKTSRERHSGHKDVVFKNDKRVRKRPPSEVTSLERNFELDYEEVFDKSNIPQLIASTSGKIVTWNDCFVKATGYRKSEIERLTIFSLVRPDKLSKFFDIVAAALRPESEGKASTESKIAAATSVEQEESKDGTKAAESFECAKGADEGDDAKKANTEAQAMPSRLMNYAAITLPCIDFPAMRKRNERMSDSVSIIDPLTVTVTLMADKDPRRRCFHCVFTNCQGTNGALGSITPELLASLFSMPLRRRKKHLPSHRRHKRVRIVQLRSAAERNDMEVSEDEEQSTQALDQTTSIGGPSKEPPKDKTVEQKEKESSK
jgi:PAS domain-containing protein